MAKEDYVEVIKHAEDQAKGAQEEGGGHDQEKDASARIHVLMLVYGGVAERGSQRLTTEFAEGPQRERRALEVSRALSNAANEIDDDKNRFQLR
jgi:hypothetical protein